MRRIGVVMAVALLAGATAAAQTLTPPSDYPSRVVSLIIPYPPGGSADGMARPLAQQLTGQWPEPVIIERAAEPSKGDQSDDMLR